MGTYGDSTYGTVATYGGGSTHQPSASEVAGTTANVMGATGTLIQISGGPKVSPIWALIQGGVQVFGGVGEIAGAIVTDVGTDGAATPISIPVIVNGVANVISGIGAITGAFQPSSPQTPYPPVVPQYQCNVCAAMNRIMNAFLATGAASPTLAGSISGGATPDAVAAAVWATPSLQWSTFTQAQLDDIWGIISQLADNGGIKLDPFGWFGNVDSMTTGASPTNLGLHPDPANILATDTLVTWLTRELPSYTWAVDSSTHRVKGTASGAGAHSVYCAISGPAFEWLKNYMYTPSSGPPKRSLVADWDLMFAMIPINY